MLSGPDHLRACPSLLERSGVHPIRDIARRWCRENVDVALGLPSWSLDIVRDVFGDAIARDWESSRPSADTKSSAGWIARTCADD